MKLVDSSGRLRDQSQAGVDQFLAKLKKMNESCDSFLSAHRGVDCVLQQAAQ